MSVPGQLVSRSVLEAAGACRETAERSGVREAHGVERSRFTTGGGSFQHTEVQPIGPEMTYRILGTGRSEAN